MAAEEATEVASFRDLLSFVRAALAAEDTDAGDLEERLQAAQPQFLALLQHRVQQAARAP